MNCRAERRRSVAAAIMTWAALVPALPGIQAQDTVPVKHVVFVEEGELSEAVETGGTWQSREGWLQARGREKTLDTTVGVGPGDFEISARLAIDGLDNSAAAFTIGGSHFGFEGAHGKIFLTGRLYGDAWGKPIADPADFLQDGRPFDFAVQRRDGTLTIAIDGKTVHEQEVPTTALGAMGFKPWRATMRLKRFEATGRLDARFLAWQFPIIVKEIGSVKKIILLPPGPDNPRNSEGDFVRLKDGRLLFIYTHFTGGRGDHSKAHLAGRISDDCGASWTQEDVVILPNEGDWNIMSVSLLRLDDGRIAMFYARKNSLTDCRPLVRFSTDETKTWSEPIEIIPDEAMGYYVLNNDRVIQLANGRLVVPVALHNRPTWDEPDWSGEVTCYLSDDQGLTWHRSKTQQKAFSPEQKRVVAQEPGVIELQDGRIMMFVRTNVGVQYVSYSEDGGETWSSLAPSNIASPQSPASIERVPSTGDLLMVWNNHADIPEELAGKRTPFNVAISSNEGKTWERIKTLEDDPQGWYCYTAITFCDDYVVLGHCTGKRTNALATTQITRFPIDWALEK